MQRYLPLVLVGSFVFVPMGFGEPTDDGKYISGVRVEGATLSENKDRPVPGSISLEKEFIGGKRACVIVIGDHDPEVVIGVSVFEIEKGKAPKLVAQDQGRDDPKENKDFVAAIWYPNRTATYQIEIRNYGAAYNNVSVALN